MAQPSDLKQFFRKGCVSIVQREKNIYVQISYRTQKKIDWKTFVLQKFSRILLTLGDYFRQKNPPESEVQTFPSAENFQISS